MKRIDYDEAAPRYDLNPYRAKRVDPHLVSFLQGRDLDGLHVLDLACGTGNQLIANHEAYPSLRMTGCDLSEGMLSEARNKRPDLAWVQGSLTELPFEDGVADFVSCQYAFHHVADKPKGARELARVTASKGRFVMQNIHPHAMQDCLLFKTFPRSYEQDLIDFMPPEELSELLRVSGFSRVTAQIERVDFEVSLESFLESVSDQLTNSELALLTKAEHEEGLASLRAQIAQCGGGAMRPDFVVLMTLIADRD